MRISDWSSDVCSSDLDHHIVEPAPTLIAREQRRIAEVEPEPRALDKHFGQRRDVAQAEVAPLPRYRVNAVRRVADKRDPGGDDRRAVMTAERIGQDRKTDGEGKSVSVRVTPSGRRFHKK